MADDENSKRLDAKLVPVELAERGYPIHIGRHMLEDLPDKIRERLPRANHAVVISDATIAGIANQVNEPLLQAGWRLTAIEVPSGENSKSVVQAERIWNTMLADHTDRGSVVIAVGGGVIGDLAGFAAATFARGIPLVQVPTTLLSQVDSSVGGKTGINLPGTKNIVGAFWQPTCVMIDTATLDSLPQREYVSGLAEVAKYGVILLPKLFEYLEQQCESAVAKSPETIAHLVSESCIAKAQVVKADERETTGLRAILNYGHTFAHAIESTVGYGTLLHGEAVAIGMHMAANLAQIMGRIDLAFVQRQHQLLSNLQLPTKLDDADSSELWKAMQHDKKVEYGKLRFILPMQLGKVELVAGISEADVCKAIEKANA